MFQTLIILSNKRSFKSTTLFSLKWLKAMHILLLALFIKQLILKMSEP